MDVAREGVDALDKFLALGAAFGVVDEVVLLGGAVHRLHRCIVGSGFSSLQLPALLLHRQRSMSYLDLTQNSS